MTRSSTLLLLLLLLLLAGCPRSAPAPVRLDPAGVPERLLIIVLDQLRPDYVDRLRLPHLTRFREQSAHFPEALVGHLASSTFVGHTVIPRGTLSRRAGWVDELYLDREGRLGPRDRLLYLSEAGLPAIQKVMDPSVPHVRQAFGLRRRFVAIGGKSYAVQAMAGRDADIVVHHSARLTGAPPEGPAWKGWVRPEGRNVPAYLLGVPGSRYWLDARPAFGTASNPVTLGGLRFFAGSDPARQGGDAWVTDAVLAYLARRQDWGTLLVTLGAIDRVGHMFSPRDLDHPNPSPVRLADTLRTADAQVGRLLAALDRLGLASSTLVVVTADHGGLHVADLHALRTPGGAGPSWGWIRHGARDLPPQPELRALAEAGALGISSDTAVRVWMEPGSTREAAVLERMERLPGAIATYRRVASGGRLSFVRTTDRFAALPDAERRFARTHADALVDTLVCPSGPALVTLLDDRTGYGAVGDHGGAQEAAQRIPLMIRGPGVRFGRYPRVARQVDLAATIWALRRQRPGGVLDGRPLCEAVVRSPACP
jgi:hypothetical protein